MAGERWTNLLLAVHAVLEEWDRGESFDLDASHGGELMEALKGPVAAVDLIEAAKADAVSDLLATAKVVDYELLGRYDYPEVQEFRAAIAKAEGRDAK